MAKFNFVEGKITEKEILDFEIKNSDNIGATCAFKGSVRADNLDGQNVVAIEFTAHEEIAINTANEILEKADQEFNLIQSHILHSLGRINVSEICFYVGVKSAHRKEAFEALAWIVNKFKDKVPLFGKEIMENGTYVWKSNKK